MVHQDEETAPKFPRLEGQRELESGVVVVPPSLKDQCIRVIANQGKILLEDNKAIVKANKEAQNHAQKREYVSFGKRLYNIPTHGGTKVEDMPLDLHQAIFKPLITAECFNEIEDINDLESFKAFIDGADKETVSELLINPLLVKWCGVPPSTPYDSSTPRVCLKTFEDIELFKKQNELFAEELNLIPDAVEGKDFLKSYLLTREKYVQVVEGTLEDTQDSLNEFTDEEAESLMEGVNEEYAYELDPYYKAIEEGYPEIISRLDDLKNSLHYKYIFVHQGKEYDEEFTIFEFFEKNTWLQSSMFPNYLRRIEAFNIFKELYSASLN